MSTSRPRSAPVSRRRFLQLGGALGASAFLLACDASTATPPPPTPVPTPTPTPGPPASPTPATGSFRMATWLGYIDIADDLTYPSLDRFTQETGVVVDYQELIEDNEEFFVTDLAGPIESGVATGWDVVVLTDWMAQRLADLGWLETIDTSSMINYPGNLEARYSDRAWDPDNTLAAPYLSGMTGLGFDRTVTGPVTSVSTLFDDALAGRITYLTEMNDTIGMAAIANGDDPSTLTQAQFDAALATVTRAIRTGVGVPMNGNDYLEGMIEGDVVLALAWSGDVAGTRALLADADRDFGWALPREGGMLWTENMTQAERFIDWYYDPANSAPIIGFVRYLSPVTGTAEALAELDPDAADDPAMFPSEAALSRLRTFVSVDAETREAWEAAFRQAIRTARNAR
jgi:spermidine/putrescine transport system substrate-binding protein